MDMSPLPTLLSEFGIEDDNDDYNKLMGMDQCLGYDVEDSFGEHFAIDQPIMKALMDDHENNSLVIGHQIETPCKEWCGDDESFTNQMLIAAANPSSSTSSTDLFVNSNNIEKLLVSPSNLNIQSMVCEDISCRYDHQYNISNSNSKINSDNNSNCEKTECLVNNKRARITSRTPLQARDHNVAERKRREKLSQLFIALAALIPGLKETNKTSILVAAMKHLKELRERERLLGEELNRKKKKADEPKKAQIRTTTITEKAIDHEISSCGGESYQNNIINKSSSSWSSSSLIPVDIEGRFSERKALIRIHCDRKKGLLTELLNEIETLGLVVVNSCALPFGHSATDITVIAEMDAEFSMTSRELVRNLRLLLLKLQGVEQYY